VFFNKRFHPKQNFRIGLKFLILRLVFNKSPYKGISIIFLFQRLNTKGTNYLTNGTSQPLNGTIHLMNGFSEITIFNKKTNLILVIISFVFVDKSLSKRNFHGLNKSELLLINGLMVS